MVIQSNKLNSDRTDIRMLNLCAHSISREIYALNSQQFVSGLYIVATPIGNLSDITLRALYVLTIADKVYCENKHISQKLFARYGIVRVLKNYHEHNAVNVRREILADISNGKRVALICDAGTPTISDPGFKLIATIIKAGYYVTSIPGPSAAITALTISGIPTDRFLFAGFLNSKSSARKKEIQMLAQVPTTLLFYEAPHRLCQMLADLIEYLGDRPAVLVRELTKKYEECKRGLLSDLFEWAYNTPVRGEFTVVVAPPENKEISDGAIIKRLHQVLADISLSKAAKQVAEEFNVSRKRVYSICLDLKHDQD